MNDLSKMVEMIKTEDSLYNQIILMGALAIVAFIAFAYAYRRGFLKYKVKRSDSIGLKTVIGAFALFFLVQILFVPAFIYVSKSIAKIWPESILILKSQGEVWIHLIASCAMLLSFLIYLSFLNKKTKQIILGNLKGSSLLIGASVWFLAFPVASLVGEGLSLAVKIFFQIEPSEQVAVSFVKKTLENPVLFSGAFLLVTVLVPCIEEFLFRGCLQTWMRGRWGWKSAIVFSSLIFTLFHFAVSQGWNNIEILSSLFVLSLFLGYLYEREFSLLASIGLHSTFNFVTLMVLFFQ